jgi:hypothetical protein
LILLKEFCETPEDVSADTLLSFWTYHHHIRIVSDTRRGFRPSLGGVYSEDGIH